MADELDWTPRIVAAEALSATHFAIALSELHYDDPFTAVLVFDGQFSQPWSRTDVAREITALSGLAPPNVGNPASFVALSNEGDVYFIGDEVERDKIVGAGVSSPDATGAGSLSALAVAGDGLFASGQGQQFYRRRGKAQWHRIPIGIVPEPGWQAVSFNKLAPVSEHDLYLLGVAAPAITSLDKRTEDKLIEADDWDALFQAHADAAQQSGTAGRVDEGRLFHWNGTDCVKVELPVNNVIHDAYVESPDKLWLVGTAGMILVGNARDGFQRAISSDPSVTFLSFTRYDGRYYAASDYALHVFDGRTLSPIKPRLQRSPPNPFRIKAVDHVLLYFDYKQGVHRFDGTEWSAMPIPPELLTRGFQGLKRQGG